MDEKEFRKVVQEEWKNVPPPYNKRITNVAVLVEDEPSDAVRAREALSTGEVLLGIYQGVPLVERGEGYGINGTLPDTITVYRLPTLLEAEELLHEEGGTLSEKVRKVVRDTIWHEIGHYFGLGDAHIHAREDEGTNTYR